ncbi:hypothetical protein BBK36DRAFT_1119606 [Trichoderma citrinoviride]|uniref:BZIP domain-containing protein n=1 Tax=Trichoderma citrinoviride TaxID=58853 RepID=A0A2T4BB61_9HYPO|nr:hypothetical protein BBK36DRAFT_1119606 [Trichoderma citrinoviride]PTB66528.1 hypothetical protein BBK36DRAFT_1119606 [Trichoderma citrinoviride]
MVPSQRAPTRASHRPDAVVDANAAPTASEIRHARRRIQNRLNQRAHRSRARDRKVGSTAQPYHVHRWRIDDGRDDMPRIIRPARKNNSDRGSGSGVPVNKTKPAPSSDPALSGLPGQHQESDPHCTYCLLSDHLLHLIHFNVLRGLSYNKRVIKPTALLECSGTASAQLKRVLPHLPEPSSLSPPLCLPESLAPTTLQLSCPHSTWIDVFPFPKMRDNLIRWENYFSHAEFLTDLLGNLISCMTNPPPRTGRGSRLLRVRARVAAHQGVLGEGGDDDDDDRADYGDDDGNDGGAGDDAPADRRGFILWGEPFHKDSWEVTPGFLRKWSWAIEGCSELIESSNRWRTARGETPLRMMLS